MRKYSRLEVCFLVFWVLLACLMTLALVVLERTGVPDMPG